MTITPQQLAELQKPEHLGSSQAAAICGLSPWETALEVYLRKTGQQLSPKEATQAMDLGNLLEPVVAGMFARKTGLELVEDNEKTYHNPDAPGMICHPDRFIAGTKEILEIKTTSAFIANKWGAGKDEIPEQYIIQVQHQMACLPWVDSCRVAVLIGGNEYRDHYRIGRDKEIILALTEIEVEFLENVKKGVPPAPDFQHKSTAELLKKMYPGTDGSEVELPAELWEQHLIVQEAKERIKLEEGRKEAALNAIKAAMGSSAIGRMQDGGYFRKEVTVNPFQNKGSKYVKLTYSTKG